MEADTMKADTMKIAKRKSRYYGIAYLNEDDTIQYKISTDYLELCQWSERSIFDNQYPTPIVELDINANDTMQQMTENMIAHIQGIYDDYYFQALKVLSDTAPNEVAYELLEEQQAKLTKTSDILELQLFGALVCIAAESKVLSAPTAQQFMDWLYDAVRDSIWQGEPDEAQAITVYGFAYEGEDGEMHYYADRNAEYVYRKKAQQDKIAMFTTAVLQKNYSAQQPNIETCFTAELRQLFFVGYLDLFRSIKRMPGEILEREFDRLCDSVKVRCDRIAYDTFITYGFRWNIKQHF